MPLKNYRVWVRKTTGDLEPVELAAHDVQDAVMLALINCNIRGVVADDKKPIAGIDAIEKTVSSDGFMQSILDVVSHYPCGCRRVGGVGDPGCPSCTEPGLRG